MKPPLTLVTTTVTTNDGIFTCIHPNNWKPMNTSIGVFRLKSGTIMWFMYKPMGTLVKYTCGTKRFISERIAPDLKTICSMVK